MGTSSQSRPRLRGASALLLAALVVATLGFAALRPPIARAASITVTTTADTLDAAGTCPAVTLASLPGPDGQTSLREAVCAANSNPGTDTITFSVNGTFALTGAANEDNGGAGDLDIKQSLAIQGNGTTNTIIDGSGIERIFDVFPSAASTFDLSNMTIQNGDTRSTSFKEGGALYLHNNVTATINSCQIINNFSGANGAIENRGTLTISNTVITGNQTIPASGSVVGGGLHNAGTLSINNTTIANNSVRGEGGGIATTTGAAAVVTITNTTISGNTASVTGGGLGNGGAISTTGNQGTLNITNSTISGNHADNNGGGAYFVTPGGGTGNVTLNNVTITNNTTDNDNNGAGAGGGFAQNTSAVTLRNTIVAGNFNSVTSVRDDISGAVVASSSYNLVGDGTGSTGITNGVNNNQVGSGASPIDPLLGPLANNTGPTLTHALLGGSPAINSGNNATCAATDQRGIARPVGGVCDKGSFELADITPPDTTITSNPPNPSASSTATFTFTGNDSGGSGLAGFQCRIDGGSFTPCTSPQTYIGLADGSHTFQVRAVDGSGNVDPTPASFTWVIDTVPATVTNVTSTKADGTYGAGTAINVTVTFSEAVTVAGTPQLTLETGATDAVVNYTSGSGTTTLTFTYTVAAGHASPDLDYVGTSALALNGGTIRDAATNNATLTLATPGTTGSLGFNKAIVIDTTAPTVTNVTSTKADGTYGAGTAIDVTVTFAEAVTVTGTPQLTLETGATDAVVNYASGSGTSTLTFTYTVAAGHTSPDLDYVGTGALALNVGTIQDAAGNDATLTLPAPGAVGSLGNNKALVIDGIAPTVAFSSAAADPTNVSPIAVTVTFSKSVSGFTAGDITTSNGTVNNFAGSGAVYTFDLVPVGQGPVTADIAAGVASDTSGNDNAAAAQFSRTYDTVVPTANIVDVTPDPRSTAVPSITIVFSEAVSGFNLADLRLTRGGGANLLTGAQTLTSADNITWTLGNLAGLTGTGGTYALTLTAGGAGIADAAGNALATDATDSWVTAISAPVSLVTINQAAGQADPANAGPIRFTVVFSSPVADFATGDVTLAGTAGATTAVVTQVAPLDGTTYEVAVSGMTTNGTVIASLAAGVAHDAAANPSPASTSTDNTVTFSGQAALTVTANGPGTVSPGTGTYPLGPLNLTAVPNTGALFTGWTVDGVPVGWNPNLTLTFDQPRAIVATFAARPGFGDVPTSRVAWDAITQLAARGVIKGYGDGTFGPDDSVLRAQMAALIVRAFHWDNVNPSGPVPFSDISEVDSELQRAIAILAGKGIINGYGDGTFGPTDIVLRIQVVSFVTRSMVQAGLWQPVTQDDPNVYPGLPLASGHRLDLLTYVKYAGAIPDRPTGQAWADWNTTASRAWTAQVLWQALNSYFSTNRIP